MKQVPHITHQHYWKAATQLTGNVKPQDICNKAIEIALAEQSQEQYEADWLKLDAEKAQEQYITADEARKLGAGKAEFQYDDGVWKVCGKWCAYSAKGFKYRAIKQPEPVASISKNEWNKRIRDSVDLLLAERGYAVDSSARNQLGLMNFDVDVQSVKTAPVEPTCQVRNLDTGELKTMTREAAKLLQAETKDVCDWSATNCIEFPNKPMRFDCIGIYTYKLKANLVKLDGKLVTREAAIAEYESKKDTCDVWIKSDVTVEWELTKLFLKFIVYANECNCEYQLRPKPLKQIEWAGSREDVIALLNELGVTK